MDADSLDLIFAPVTREQARLFAGIARLLDRRGVACRLSAPSAEVAEPILDEWGARVAIADASDRPPAGREPQPDHIGAYDAWRHDWDETLRDSLARAAIEFWHQQLADNRAAALVLWNGRDHVFVESATHVARQRGIEILFLELGPLRRAPMTVAVTRGGVNAAAEFRRPELFQEPLTPWESARLQKVRERFRRGIKLARGRGPFAFLPLQVDDDTQLFYYAPHFADQTQMLARIVAALPDELPLIVKPHPLCDARRGQQRYLPLLREIDSVASASTNTLGLIAGAAVVVTNNSSAGVEALLLERPVVVLGEANYGKRGFTLDYQNESDLPRLIQQAVSEPATPESQRQRDRFLYELLFHELVHLENHPLQTTLDDAEHEQLAIRILDLLQPGRLGSDWRPLFDEIHALRDMLNGAVRQAIQDEARSAVVVVTRFAAGCLGDPSGREVAILEDLTPETAACLRGRDAVLLAPELSAGQRDAAATRLRILGAQKVRDLAQDLSGVPCPFHITRFNQLPRAMRDELHRTSDYWDYYLTQSGISPENTPQKNTQAETVRDRLTELAPESLLEYGCGDGRILERLLKGGDRPWTRVGGVDSCGRMLELARERLRGCPPVTLLPADARVSLPFPDASFDAVLTCGVLAHVPADDLLGVVSRLHAVARRTLLHWEVFEAHRPTPGEHYTNSEASRTIHRTTFDRFGPVEARVEDLRPLTGQGSLLARYDIDRPQITVLTLHAVGSPDTACESFDYRNMFLTPRRLDELLEGLAQAGYSFLTLREALAGTRGAAPPQHKTLVLTFDDGYASVFESAFPLLERRGIRAAAFVPTGFIGRRFGGNTREGSGPTLRTMTPDQIRKLRDAGWDIGSHSVTHPLFARLTQEQTTEELTRSKADLEDLLGRDLRLFAFPYGEPEVAYRPEQIEQAAAAGYELALTTNPGFVSPGCESIDWPRIGVGCDTTADSLLDQLADVHRATIGWPAAAAGEGPSLKQRVRAAVRRCVEKGVQRIALYGAGRHTAKLLQSAPLWPLHVLGIVDDDPSLRGSQRYGLPVHAAADLPDLPLDAVLISSDQYEEAIYQRIAPLEARGIQVLRLYAPAD